ncbi:squalene epoxidase-domain-containing protein [Polychytrium aggregatum]|uniref:squalene epoxidase-domain-containing protein n=1 Tax=Polychytrium aggregatum TaxID=110093 RepID=UPI0022FDC498|nr:squalene epoxidase-domain-containing protein [Polychytrium aggregatum]KAI9206578.1 squalene epoxidase-domain-containing protein [Polychytrium aggregatum]
MSQDIEYDIIVVGAGVVGCTAAAALGRDGRKVLLIERDWSEPDRIVGELLQPGGVKALKELGLDWTLDGIDGIIHDGYVVYQNPEDHVLLKYPTDRGVSQGIAFHHGKFIMNLRKAARQAPNVTTLEATVTALATDETDKVVGVSVSTKTEPGAEPVLSTIYAPLTLVVDGCFSKFRKDLSPNKVTISSHFVGMVLKNCNLPYKHHGHVILCKPSPVLLYQIGTDDTRILMDVPGKMPTGGELKTYLKDTIGPQLPKSVQPSFYEAIESERLRSMPNQWLPSAMNKQEGVILLGDANNMRHPLTGGGMTVAFWDVVHLRDHLHPKIIPTFQNSNTLVRSQMVKLHRKRKELSSVINVLAQALYSLFSANDQPLMMELQKGCFGYFQLGGRCASTPVGLLAGLRPEPLTLFNHFFLVALYASYTMTTSGPIYMVPYNIVKSILVLWTACVVILPVIWTEIRA